MIAAVSMGSNKIYLNKKSENMDTQSFKKVKSSSILIIKERDDGTKKKQVLEKTTMFSSI